MVRSNDIIFVQSPLDINKLEIPPKDYNKLVEIVESTSMPFLYNPLDSKIFFVRSMDYEEWYDIDRVLGGTF